MVSEKAGTSEGGSRLRGFANASVKAEESVSSARAKIDFVKLRPDRRMFCQYSSSCGSTDQAEMYGLVRSMEQPG